MDSQIEEIKQKLSVVDVVGSYVKLTKTGINYRGACPFHSEKKPSFFVNPARGLWHCFGCGAGSSIFDFVMKIEGVEFGDALRILAQKAGVQLKRENPQLRTERARLYEICDLATSFFQKQLEASAAGKEAKEYLLGRGITRESILKWRLGYSPDTWNGLTDFLIGKGYQREEVVNAGLAIKKEGRNDSYDRFRGRIIFPVFDLNSQPVGFGGRVFKQGSDKEVAKYINTPQTLLYDKSGVMYGLNFAKLAIRKADACVVTEGYTDVIMCHQAGFENTVAASGTALTSRHLGLLKRYSENLILAFDMDVAGDSATKRGINLAQAQGFNIRIIESYVKDSDPADIILKDPATWEESVAKARSIMDYYVDSAFAKFDRHTPDGKKHIAEVVLPPIKRLRSSIEQSYWVQKLAGMLGIKEEAVFAELAKVQLPQLHEEPVAAPVASEFAASETQGDRKKMIEEKIIGLIFKNPAYLHIIHDAHYALFSGQIAELLRELKKIAESYQSAEGEEPKLKDVFAKIFDGADIPGKNEKESAYKNFLAALALKAETDYEDDGEEEVELCVLQLKNIELKNKLQAISQALRQAEESNDHHKAQSLIDEFNTLAKEL